MSIFCSGKAGGKQCFCLLFVLVFVFLCLRLPAWADISLHKGKPAKYVFVFVGDGLGIPHRQAPEAFLAAMEGKNFGDVKMTMNTFPVQGVTTTYANDRFIIGSAASGTALASGFITNIGFIGMGPDLKPVRSIAHMAKEKGMKVGIVSSVSIDHATPAAFYANQPHRSMYHEIAHDLADSGFDYFGGGGFRDPEGTRSKAPKGDALEKARRNGYAIATDRRAFERAKSGQSLIAYNANLPDGKALPYAMDASEDDISLAEFTRKGIELLNNPKGFFMMVEGGKIDWASHANDAAATIHDTLAFDAAIAEAVAFARKHPKETLIVVTGDHECGGMTIGFAGTKYESAHEILKNQKISFQRFETILADYRKSHQGKTSFEDMIPLVEANFGLKFDGTGPMGLKDYEIRSLKEAFLHSMAGLREKGQGESYLLYGDYDPFSIKVTHILNQKAGIGWTSYSHTGAPVITSAMGVGEEVFNGYYHQSDLGKKLLSTMGFSPRYADAAPGAGDMRQAAVIGF
ncbi:alkaline phosphatase [Desulfobotulus sp. H1]|uniref:Alkaline phosphatase n=1 Tax=Desulfobotulus pelophilus TaxID=2823377 RepID=A0ABT3N7T8_9BACT|nr:alkaline phosphatase [Desulfobotulus pelophilus]MCW7753518.1 alkaline phosphatase [Desulfobotulus pelophilus]